MSCFHPKYPLKFHQHHHWMTCCPPRLPQPHPSFFQHFAHGLDLLDELSSLLVHLVVVLRGRKQALISAKFCGPSTSYPFVTLSRPGNLYNPNHSKALHKIHPTSSMIQLPRPLLHAHHPSQKVSQIIFQHILLKEDQQMMFQAKTSSQRHPQAL